VAIVQISRITNRKGLQINLPQLAGAEFGWCTDTRKLFIGNGTLEDGAPEIGNTEVLTEFSEVIPPPVIISLQNNVAVERIIITQDPSLVKAFTMSYTIIRGTTYRTGVLTVTAGSISGASTYTDDYTENADTGITLSADQADNNLNVYYTSTDTGLSGTMAYVINNLF
jgi:hypothetical protein